MPTIAQTGKTIVNATYEIVEDKSGHQRHLHYLSGGDGLFAIYTLDEKGDEAMYYIHKDYQGSFETITNHKGTAVEKLSYDPWGRRRNPTNWTFTNVPEIYLFDRGYTGHEHLDQFGLINMSFAVKQAQSESWLSAMPSASKTGEASGRMYDPMLGRFLSPDNYVQAPHYTQNFNRYSYVLNNPLKYTDPSGNAFSPGGNGHFQINTPTKEETVAMLITTFATAGIGSFLGPIVVNGSSAFLNSVLSYAVPSAIAGFSGSFLGGATSSLIYGNSINSSLLSGVKASGYGLVSGFFKGAYYGLTNYVQAMYEQNRNRVIMISNIIRVDGIVEGEYSDVYLDYNNNEVVYLANELGIAGGGVRLTLCYRDDNTGLSEFRWIQTIETNDPLGTDKTQYVDPQPPHKDAPFYTINEINAKRSNVRGCDLIFYDRPTRELTNGTYWKAELSVVGKNTAGAYTRIQTISYGFYIENISVIRYPISYISTPSDFHLNTIK